MDSGRTTPEAMTRPPSGHANVPASSLQTPSPIGAHFEEGSPRRPLSIAGQPDIEGECVHAAFYDERIAQSYQQIQATQVQFYARIASFAAVQSCVLLAFGFGWAMSSRFIKSNLPYPMYAGSSEDSRTSQSCSRGTRHHRSSSVESLHPIESIHPDTAGQDDPKALKTQQRRPNDLGMSSDAPLIRNYHRRVRFVDETFATQQLLQKHFDYLMPWVSDQPCENGELQMSSERNIADDLHSMSMQQFTDLSTAIYRDVRRREREPSPSDIKPPQWDQWPQNGQNRSRMMLCRTINAQFHRLVLAMVLEQARRLTDIRIWHHRRAVTAQRGHSNP